MIMWKGFLILLLATITVNGKTTKKRVCIIGTGVSGIVSTKYFSEYPNEFETVAYEKSSDVGGLWIYTDSTTVDEHGLPVHSSMYKNLRTNSVKAEMTFPDYQDFVGESNNFTYASHEEVLQYLRNYTAYFNLRQYIKFNTNVEKVKPLANTRWLTVTRDLNNGKISKTICDAVIVCSGHNVKGYIPEIWGIESFKGQVLHSHLYRTPETYADQTVVSLGASFSAVDIAIDVSPLARKVYLSHRRDKLPGVFPPNVEQVPGVVGAEGDKLVLSNGTKIRADALILGTGYVYDYPFLDNSSGIVIENGKHIRTLYKYMFNVEHPTMAFIDIIAIASHFRLVHAQANYIRKVLLDKLKLPNREKMRLEAETQLAKESDKGPIPTFAEFFDYYDEIVNESGGITLPWWMRPYLDEAMKLISEDPMGYKHKRLVLHENSRTVEFV